MVRRQKRRAAVSCSHPFGITSCLHVGPLGCTLGHGCGTCRWKIELGRRHAVYRVSLLGVIHATAESRTSQNSLDELILPQWLGEVVIHLRRETFLPIANHGVSGQSDDWCRWENVVTLPLANLRSSFETTLSTYVSLPSKGGHTFNLP
jgi:hypothetical protein